MRKTAERPESRSSDLNEPLYEASERDRQAYLEINKTILELLKEPVSLGIKGSNNNRGRQR